MSLVYCLTANLLLRLTFLASLPAPPAFKSSLLVAVPQNLFVDDAFLVNLCLSFAILISFLLSLLVVVMEAG